MKVALVTWVDSKLGYGGWEPAKGHRKRRGRVRCQSVGFVLADDKHGVVLAGSREGKNVAGVVHIPRRAILAIDRVTG